MHEYMYASALMGVMLQVPDCLVAWDMFISVV